MNIRKHFVQLMEAYANLDEDADELLEYSAIFALLHCDLNKIEGDIGAMLKAASKFVRFSAEILMPLEFVGELLGLEEVQIFDIGAIGAIPTIEVGTISLTPLKDVLEFVREANAHKKSCPVMI